MQENQKNTKPARDIVAGQWGGVGREGEYLACSRPHLEPATMCGPRASLDGPSGPWTPFWYSSHPSAPSLVLLPSCQPLLLEYYWMRLNPQISKLSLLTVGLWELTKQHTCCVWSLGQESLHCWGHPCTTRSQTQPLQCALTSDSRTACLYWAWKSLPHLPDEGLLPAVMGSGWLTTWSGGGARRSEHSLSFRTVSSRSPFTEILDNWANTQWKLGTQKGNITQ